MKYQHEGHSVRSTAQKAARQKHPPHFKHNSTSRNVPRKWHPSCARYIAVRKTTYTFLLPGCTCMAQVMHKKHPTYGRYTARLPRTIPSQCDWYSPSSDYARQACYEMQRVRSTLPEQSMLHGCGPCPRIMFLGCVTKCSA